MCSRDKQWEFTPLPGMQEGQKICGGDIYANIPESVVMNHRVPAAQYYCFAADTSRFVAAHVRARPCWYN